jgi:hypothetical protein
MENVAIFYDNLEYFTAIWYSFMAFWYSLLSFGIFIYFLVCLDQKNLVTLVTRLVDFLPMGRLFTLGIFLVTKSSQNLGQFFSAVKVKR